MSEHTPDAASRDQESSSRGYEITDVRPRPLIFSALLLALAVALVCVFLIWFFGLLEGSAKRHDPQLSPLIGAQSPPPPRLQTDPSNDLDRMRAAEDRALTGYRWIDKERGVVQLPVDRAMDLLLEEGLPETKPEVPLVEPDDESAGKTEEPR
jgi:hypothetical protein